MTFPFELVYERFARITVERGAPPDNTPPMLFKVDVRDGEIVGLAPVDVMPLFEFDNALDRLAMLIKMIVPQLGPDTCIVMVMEAWYKSVPKGESDAYVHGDLADDPEAKEVMLIQMYTRHIERIGTLPIGPGRSVSYKPLEEGYTAIAGRFVASPTPPEDKLH